MARATKPGNSNGHNSARGFEATLWATAGQAAPAPNADSAGFNGGRAPALEYAEILDVPFAYSSNGDAFLEHDRTATSGTVTSEIPLDQFPTKITNRTVDKSFEIYLCLYQAVTGTEGEQNIYKQFSPGFFDLVVVDECHRGSAADDASWRKVLEYFSSATQIGLTATPKETKEVSNIEYFR